jgi:hypothetical protein
MTDWTLGCTSWMGRTASVSDKNVFVLARSHKHLLEISDVVLRLLAASVVQKVCIFNWRHLDGRLILAPTLAYLMEQCQSLKALLLIDLEMDEDHCRVLGGYSRPDLGIIMSQCNLTSAGASALAEILGRNQGPTKLICCEIDNFVLADGLRGNSRLKLLKFRISNSFDVGNRAILAIAGALREKKGLVDLELGHRTGVSDETWGAICTSLKTHPTLEVLDRVTFAAGTTAPAVITSRIEVLLNMNTSIHTIRLHSCYSEHAIFRELIIPHLETNRFRPRLLAIQKICPISYRAKVLGRALLSARNHPNRFWMLLAGNAEVAFPSTTATTTPTANLPTPAPSTANVASVAAISPTSTGATSSISVSTIDIVTPMSD